MPLKGHASARRQVIKKYIEPGYRYLVIKLAGA